MTSTPAFDPNVFTTGIEVSLWNKLNKDPQKPLLNRVIQAIYAPGSVFKIVTSVAALEERLITPSTSYFCPGYVMMYNRMFRCHKGAGHGWVDLRKAITGSCNAYFYNIGVRLEIERISSLRDAHGVGGAHRRRPSRRILGPRAEHRCGSCGRRRRLGIPGKPFPFPSGRAR